MKKKLRVGIIGCGTIGAFILDAVMGGKVENTEVVVVCGRSEKSKGKQKTEEYGIKWLTEPLAMLDFDLDVIIETASHQVVEMYGAEILKKGIDFVPLSLGALVDSELFERFLESASKAGSILLIPSGGIGGLDAVQAIRNTGVKEIGMTTRKAPQTWKGNPHVEQMNIDLENLDGPTTLFQGSARDCVKKFPQNINVAAALSLAGIGFDATQICIEADPAAKYTTHEIHCESDAGRITMIFQDVPMLENPKTAYLACLSGLAALKMIRSHCRIGT